jgi:MOSC domain-containing protein YiiM
MIGLKHDIDETKPVPRVVAINRSSIKGVPKQTVDFGEFIVDFGLKDDAHGGKGHRQVSLLGQESIDSMCELGIAGLGPGTFAENITTENIVLYQLKPGDVLQIGDTVLKVTQIGKKCHQGCAIFRQTGKCVMPREGIFAKVVRGGKIYPGDKITVSENH